MKDIFLKKFLLQTLITLNLCYRRSTKNQASNEGFTLIELLVVIIILGILAAIAIPTFLNQTFKAKQSEAKTYVSAMNTAQKAYFTEKTELAPNLDILALDIVPVTENYVYTVSTASQSAIADARSLKPRLKAYTGQVFLYISTGNIDVIDVVALSVICEARDSGPGSVTAPSNAVCDPATSVKVEAK
jgi:type IV pilus assembly protein PilA